MAQKQNVRSNVARLSIKLGVSLALTIAICTPLAAQDTVVEGKAQRSGTIEERVGYADLNLRDQQNQTVLISRVKKAADRVCDVIYRSYSSIEKFNSRCPHKTYRDTKPQIDFAIANAQNGKRIATSLVVARSR